MVYLSNVYDVPYVSRRAMYEAWIADYVRRNNGDVWLKCVEACTELSAQFSELKIVKSIAVSRVSGKRWCHCWCVAPDGSIVDPTAAQFTVDGVTYE